MPATYDGYSAFTDESGVGEQFLAFGGIFLPTIRVATVEATLEEFCATRGFPDREMSWKKCSASKVHRYLAFAEFLWSLNDTHPPVDFRALVVDTTRNPLRNPDFKCATREDGFYRFYHFFLTGSLRQLATGTERFVVNVATTEDQYPYRTDILNVTVSGALRKLLSGRFEVAEVRRDTPRVSRIHQLADVLLGAVSFKYNRFDPNSHKTQITRMLERKAGRNLRADFRPAERPFNVWSFTSTGSSRWAPGARGRV